MSVYPCGPESTPNMEIHCPLFGGARCSGISSFCVESGRWSQRGRESRARFAPSGNRFSKKGLKMATKGGRRQEQVWREVRRAQQDMADNNEDYNPFRIPRPSRRGRLDLPQLLYQGQKARKASPKAPPGPPARREKPVGHSLAKTAEQTQLNRMIASPSLRTPPRFGRPAGLPPGHAWEIVLLPDG